MWKQTRRKEREKSKVKMGEKNLKNEHANRIKKSTVLCSDGKFGFTLLKERAEKMGGKKGGKTRHRKHLF